MEKVKAGFGFIVYCVLNGIRWILIETPFMIALVLDRVFVQFNASILDWGFDSGSKYKNYVMERSKQNFESIGSWFAEGIKEE